MSVVVVATFIPNPGEQDAVHAVIAAAQTEVHKEPGCELYALHEAEGKFVLIEKWASAKALDVHGEGEALKKLVADVQPLCAADIEIVTMTPTNVTDAPQSVL